MIERTRVRVPAGASGEFSPPGSTFSADSYLGICSIPVVPLWHVKDPVFYFNFKLASFSI